MISLFIEYSLEETRQINLAYPPEQIESTSTAVLSDGATLKRDKPYLLYGHSPAIEYTISAVWVEEAAPDTLNTLRTLTRPVVIGGELPLVSIVVNDRTVVTGYTSSLEVSEQFWNEQGEVKAFSFSLTIREQGNAVPVEVLSAEEGIRLTEREIALLSGQGATDSDGEPLDPERQYTLVDGEVVKSGR